MLFKTLPGDSNLAKPCEKDNQYSLLACLIGALSCLGAPHAFAIPAAIAWQIPLLADERYILEVAKDPGFADIALTAEVRGTGYAVDLKDEGIYHWRLLRPGRELTGAEGSTFVSGSFAALESGPQRQRSVRLGWPATPGADRYKLYVTDGKLKLRTMTTTATFFVVDPVTEAMMIEVVPFTGAHRTDRSYHFEPGMTLDLGYDVAPPPPAAIAAGTPSVWGTPAAAITAGVEAQPQPSALPPPAADAVPPTPAVPTPASGASRRRVYMIALYGVFDDEDISFSKIDTRLSSRGHYSGAAVSLFTQPVGGVVVSAAGGYHEHRDKITSSEFFPGRPLQVNAARFTLELGIGYDVMHLFGVHDHLLSLSFMSAATQLPLMPLIYDETAGAPPKLQKRAESLVGGGVAYGFFGSVAGLLLEGGYLVDSTDAAKLAFGRATVEFYPAEGLALLVGAFSRQTAATRCHTDKATCLREGKVHTEVQETAGFAGVGMALR